MRSKSDVKAFAQLEKAVGEQGAKQSVELAGNVEKGELLNHNCIECQTQIDTKPHIGVNRTVREIPESYNLKRNGNK